MDINAEVIVNDFETVEEEELGVGFFLELLSLLLGHLEEDGERVAIFLNTIGFCMFLLPSTSL